MTFVLVLLSVTFNLASSVSHGGDRTINNFLRLTDCLHLGTASSVLSVLHTQSRCKLFGTEKKRINVASCATENTDSIFISHQHQFPTSLTVICRDHSPNSVSASVPNERFFHWKCFPFSVFHIEKKKKFLCPLLCPLVHTIIGRKCVAVFFLRVFLPLSGLPWTFKPTNICLFLFLHSADA